MFIFDGETLNYHFGPVPEGYEEVLVDPVVTRFIWDRHCQRHRREAEWKLPLNPGERKVFRLRSGA